MECLGGTMHGAEGGGGIRNNKMTTTAYWLTVQNKVSFQLFVLLL